MNKELNPFQISFMNHFIYKYGNEQEVKEIIKNYLNYQIGKTTMLKSNYIKIFLRNKKIKQIQNKLIK